MSPAKLLPLVLSNVLIACAPLVADGLPCAASRHNATVLAGAPADEYVWCDSRGGMRSIVLAEDAEKGGMARQFSYPLADGRRRTV
ncbi:MAG: hypothetical protein GC160_24795 [Acidobacteria bacterium]|nr:hypothetical protein [Acidobacteriota bacterium]